MGSVTMNGRIDHDGAFFGWKKKKKKRWKNKDSPAEKKIALGSASKLTDAYGARLYKLKEKLWNYLLITIIRCYLEYIECRVYSVIYNIINNLWCFLW